MSERELVPNRQYTDEFKLEAVRLAESVGGNQAAKRLGIPDSSLWNWIRLSRQGKLHETSGTDHLPRIGSRPFGTFNPSSQNACDLALESLIAECKTAIYCGSDFLQCIDR